MPERDSSSRHVPFAASKTIFAMIPLGAGYLLSYLFRNASGVVAGDIMRDVGVGADVLGLLTSVYFLAFASAQLPIGVLLDRYGPRPVQVTLFLIAAAGATVSGMPTGVPGPLIGRALIGLETAGALVSGLKGRANAALNVLHTGFSFALQLAIGLIVSLWPSAGEHYPAQAYKAALLLPLTLQVLALLWFVRPARLFTQPA
ncbi:MAG: MFS transporter [Acetobacteraceae bacterium]|nr:MFS transporter [Acetobacteraceae bacterium]